MREQSIFNGIPVERQKLNLSKGSSLPGFLVRSDGVSGYIGELPNLCSMRHLISVNKLRIHPVSDHLNLYSNIEGSSRFR